MDTREFYHVDLPEYGRVKVILFHDEEFFLGEERLEEEDLSIAEENQAEGLDVDGVCTVCGEKQELECDQKTGVCVCCKNKVVFDCPEFRDTKRDL